MNVSDPDPPAIVNDDSIEPLAVWAEADKAAILASKWVSAEALNAAISFLLAVWAAPLNELSAATYSALNAVADELDNALSPATLYAIQKVNVQCHISER